MAIAGALVLQARYLLLDEPTAGLDPRGRAQMIAIIRRIVGQGRRVVISSHDIDLIYEVSDAVYVLRHGEVLAAGDPRRGICLRGDDGQGGIDAAVAGETS